MVADARMLANYIEVELNKGKSLSDIKKFLRMHGIRPELVNDASELVYKEEMTFIAQTHESTSQAVNETSKIWFIYVAFVLTVICTSMYLALKWIGIY